MNNNLSALDIIKILCIKQGKLKALSIFRIFKRHRIMADGKELILKFFDKDIFEQSDALASILIRFHKLAPNYLPATLIENLAIGSSSIQFIFDSKSPFGFKRDGRVTYTPTDIMVLHNQASFEINIDAHPNNNDGYLFYYTKDTPLTITEKIHWDEDIADNLKSLYMMLLQHIICITNSKLFSNQIIGEKIND